MTTEMNKKTAIRGSKEKLIPTHLSIRSDFRQIYPCVVHRGLSRN